MLITLYLGRYIVLYLIPKYKHVCIGTHHNSTLVGITGISSH